MTSYVRIKWLGGRILSKKVFHFILIFVVIISTAVTETVVKANGAFTDLGSVPWAEDAIYYLNEQEIINGYGNGIFGPHDKITREQAALMLVRELYPNEISTTKLAFSDVDEDSFYYNAIAVAVDHGLFEGYPDGSFKPKDPITRAATAKIFTLAYDLEGTDTYVHFTDLMKTPWATEYIRALASHNIVNGYADNTFRPNSTITRAEFSASFARILDDRFKPNADSIPKKETQPKSPYTDLTEEEMLKEIERMRRDMDKEPNTKRIGAEEFELEDGYLFEIYD